MRILVAPDKFKGSLGAAEVAEAIAAGLREVLPEAEITLLPIADGGEGTAEVICAAAASTWHECRVHNPLGRLVTARYCTIENGTTAVMEMSQASGLWRLAADERDAQRANTYGTGEMLLDAAKRSVREILIGLGGSATNDGGYGMARAIGFRFFDGSGRELGPEVPELLRLERIVRPNELTLPTITAAVDVRNTLLGDRGAARVFGPQKGVTPDQIDWFDRALAQLADVVAHDFGVDHRDTGGAGAAGGLGFGLASFCAASLRSGFEVVAERIGLAKAVAKADVVITGEGRLDAQTFEGKGPAGLARLAQTVGKPVYAIVGDAEEAGAEGLFHSVWPLVNDMVSREKAMTNAAALLRDRGSALGRRLRG